MTFEEYYKWLGFDEYPFGVYTAEAEAERHEDLYLRPANYSVLIEGLRNTSAIVIGERGTGKTALSTEAGKVLERDNNLVVRVDEFSDLRQDYSTEDLYEFLTKRISAAFFMKVADHPLWLERLSKDERIELSLFLHHFVGANTKRQLREKIMRIQNSIYKRWFIVAFNFVRGALNYGIRAAVKIASDALTRHFSALPPVDFDNTEYFGKLEIEVDDSFTVEQRSYHYLERICRLAHKVGIKKIYVVIDKVDEDTRFRNDAELIADFIKPIASNNKILTADFFHMLMFFWSTSFNYIKSEVRTNRITFQELVWDPEGLRLVADKRVSVFSGNKLRSLAEVFENVTDEDMHEIIYMCNRNPRDLWHILDKCIKCQYEIDPTKRVGQEAIRQGIRSFVTGFNYYEYYPRKANARKNSMDVYAYIKHLLKLDDYRFTKDKLNSMAGTGSSTSNYVVAMENMGLIARTQEKAQGGAVIYEIRDPKVIYAMKHKIPIGSSD